MDFNAVTIRKDEKLKLCFGGAAISGEGGGYGFGDISQADAIKLLNESFDLGIRVFDTAPIYGFGLSEQRMGEAFKLIREKVFIVSKSGVTWHNTKRVNMTNDPKVTEVMLNQSLKDLKSDYIDLYMIHWPDKNIDIRYPYEVLMKAKEVGKLRYIGLCNTNEDDFQKANAIGAVDCLQSEYNLFHSTCFNGLPDDASKMGWGSFDKGILTGRVDKNRKFDSSDCRSWAPWWKKSPLDLKFEKVDKLKKIANHYDVTLLDLALHFCLKNNINLSPIVGVKNSEQLQSMIESYKKEIGTHIIEEALKVVSEA